MSNEAEPDGQEGPQTLREAHALAWRLNPDASASLEERQEFHRCCARVYTEVADIDRRHHHEALACARIERHAAEEIGTQLSCRAASARSRVDAPGRLLIPEGAPSSPEVSHTDMQ